MLCSKTDKGWGREKKSPYSCQDQFDKFGHRWHKEIVAKQLLIRQTHCRTLMLALMKKCKKLIMKPYISLKRHCSLRFQLEFSQGDNPQTHTSSQLLGSLSELSSSSSPFSGIPGPQLNVIFRAWALNTWNALLRNQGHTVYLTGSGSKWFSQTKVFQIICHLRTFNQRNWGLIPPGSSTYQVGCSTAEMDISPQRCYLNPTNSEEICKQGNTCISHFFSTFQADSTFKVDMLIFRKKAIRHIWVVPHWKVLLFRREGAEKALCATGLL